MGAQKKINEGEVPQYYVENSQPDIYEDQIKEAFIKAFNNLIENKEEIINGYEVILEELLDTMKLEKKVTIIQNEMEIVEELFRKMVDENSRKAMDQKEYSKNIIKSELTGLKVKSLRLVGCFLFQIKSGRNQLMYMIE